MKRSVILLLFVLLVPAVFAQSAAPPEAPQPTTTVLVWASGHRTLTLFQTEVLRTSADGRWIVPDIALVGYGSTSYVEVQVGAGRYVVKNDTTSVAATLYANRVVGSESNGEFYIMPSLYADHIVRPGLRTETAIFWYQPWNGRGTKQFVIDRLKLELDGAAWKGGIGYAAYWAETRPWEHKPYITVTRKTGIGNFDVWLMKLDEDLSGEPFQVMLRYDRTF